MQAVLPSCTEELWPDFYLGGPKGFRHMFCMMCKTRTYMCAGLPVNHRFFLPISCEKTNHINLANV